MISRKTERPTIGIMLGDVESYYTIELFKGFYSCAREEEVNVVFMAGPQIPQYCSDILNYNMDGNYNYQFDSIYDYVDFMKLDALIVATGSISYYHHDYDRERFLKKHAKVPYLLMQDVSEEDKYLITDNYAGMRACIEHLAKDHGYKKICFLGGPKVNQEAKERLAAYRDVMAECGYEVTDTMIQHGNYTELVEDLVTLLLDENPGVEAIACANDNMAKACYNVCNQRNLVVGKDIAITGFDDVDMAKKVDPPLTSVSQRSFQFSYTVLKKAIALCKGEEITSGRVQPFLVKRSSCGCCAGSNMRDSGVTAEKLDRYIKKNIQKASAVLLEPLPYEKDKRRFAGMIEDYFNYVKQAVLEENKENFNIDFLFNILEEFLNYPHITDISLAMHFTEPVQVLAARTKNVAAKEQLAYIASATSQFMYTSINRKMEEDMISMNRKAWFVPSFTRDLNHRGLRDDLRAVTRPVMERLRSMNVKSCYICLFDEPVIYEENLAFKIPKEMYLSAYYNADGMVCYAKAESPRVTAENGVSSFLPESETAILTSFILFSGEKQYGILFCDVEQKDMSFLQICGIQLGSLLSYLHLNWAEQDSYQELQKSLRVIREKNSILSFISEYDDLSQLLNRRGFMEKTLSCCEENDGRKAYLVFCDLDHLKEINDVFGHGAGDFAIKEAADRLTKVLPKGAIIARIGGDEFVAVVLSEMPGFKEALRQALKEEGDRFNANEELPYYVDISVGISDFYCEPQIAVSELLERSDQLLYEEKKKRRTTIRKYEDRV